MQLLFASCAFFLFQIIYVATMPLQRMDNAGEEGFVGLDIVAGVAYSLYTSSFLVLVSLYQLYWLQILELSLLKKTMKSVQGTPENSPENSPGGGNSPGVPSRQVAPAPEQSSQQGQSPSSTSNRRGSKFGVRARRGSSGGGGGRQGKLLSAHIGNMYRPRGSDCACESDGGDSDGQGTPQGGGGVRSTPPLGPRSGIFSGV